THKDLNGGAKGSNFLMNGILLKLGQGYFSGIDLEERGDATGTAVLYRLLEAWKALHEGKRNFEQLDESNTLKTWDLK
ncbi:16779_t:CDS:2, partial [Acaulospora morrowiae]